MRIASSSNPDTPSPTASGPSSSTSPTPTTISSSPRCSARRLPTMRPMNRTRRSREPAPWSMSSRESRSLGQRCGPSSFRACVRQLPVFVTSTLSLEAGFSATSFSTRLGDPGQMVTSTMGRRTKNRNPDGRSPAGSRWCLRLTASGICNTGRRWLSSDKLFLRVLDAHHGGEAGCCELMEFGLGWWDDLDAMAGLIGTKPRRLPVGCSDLRASRAVIRAWAGCTLLSRNGQC